MAKKVMGFVKLQIPAGQATPAPPVGTALGPQGINIMAFVKEFNSRTQNQPGMILPVEVTIFSDKSFTFILKTPPAAVLLKKEAGIEKGSGQPNRNKVGKVTRAQIRKIAEIKMPDLNCESIESAMAMVAGADGRIAKIKDGWLDFDVLVATPDQMGKLGQLGRVLGPRGLMPNPKAGTVTMDVTRAVRETKAGKIEFRVDKAGNVQAAIGKVSFPLDSLETNFNAFMDQIVRSKPASSKGVYVRNVSVSSTMGPGVRIDTNPYR